MKILFIWPKPRDLILGRYETIPTTIFHKIILKLISFPKPLTFPILTALTPQEHTVELIEGMYDDIPFDKDYDLIGITCSTRYAPAAYKIADEFRNRNIPVILGGWHSSSLPEEAKQHADSVVIGEAENIWSTLVKDAENQQLKPFYKQKKPVLPEQIPHPVNIYSENSSLGVQATRGCPHGCKFCSITNMKHRNIFRMRPIEKVKKDIQAMPKTFNFHDNSLTIDPHYTKQLFRTIKGLNKKFSAFGNINVLGKDDELLKLASEAGCVSWLVGFESVSQKSIDSVGKRTNIVDQYAKAVEKIHDYGMTVLGSFVFGFDYDTEDVFDKTRELVNYCNIDVPDAMILTPLPGTPLYERLDKEGRIITKDWSNYDFEHVVFQPKNMPPEQLLTETRRLYKDYYNLGNTVKRILGSIPLGMDSFFDTFMQHCYMSTKRYI